MVNVVERVGPIERDLGQGPDVHHSDYPGPGRAKETADPGLWPLKVCVFVCREVGRDVRPTLSAPSARIHPTKKKSTTSFPASGMRNPMR